MGDLTMNGENLWFLLNAVEGIIFAICAVVFRCKPERAGFLISHFSSFSKTKKAQYDIEGLSRHVFRTFAICSVICFAGALATPVLREIAYWASTILWIIVALMNLRVDNEKLLKKYRKSSNA